METIDLIVGFDQREAISYHVFCQSVLERSSMPVRFLPLHISSIKNYKETHHDGSNAFTYSRFLCPHLMGYKGHAIYADGDMVCQGDISLLWSLRDPTKALQVIKHQYSTKSKRKYFGSINENYPRKNWSSLIIWNCEHPKNRDLSPNFIESKSGAFLHRFNWLNDDEIGELPMEWNWLATEYEPNPSAKLIHYTLGTPCFSEYSKSEMSASWHESFAKTIQGLERPFP